LDGNSSRFRPVAWSAGVRQARTGPPYRQATTARTRAAGRPCRFGLSKPPERPCRAPRGVAGTACFTTGPESRSPRSPPKQPPPVSNAAGTLKRTTENPVCHRACSPINGQSMAWPSSASLTAKLRPRPAQGLAGARKMGGERLENRAASGRWPGAPLLGRLAWDRRTVKQPQRVPQQRVDPAASAYRSRPTARAERHGA
jgi:hypothetical protein